MRLTIWQWKEELLFLNFEHSLDAYDGLMSRTTGTWNTNRARHGTLGAFLPSKISTRQS